jgi:DNA-binding IscR family transcriptional regulator
VRLDERVRDLVRDVWSGARDTLEEYLRGISLEDLCQRKRRKIGEVMYYI